MSTYTGSQAEAEEEVENEVYKGLLIIDYDKDGLPIATYKSLSVADYEIPDAFGNGYYKESKGK